MNRRDFLASIALLSTLPSLALASGRSLSIGIFPGTGTAGMFRDELRAATKPFVESLASAVERKPNLSIFRTLRHINRSLERGRLDLYFAPPTVAVAALDKGYSPIARVRDPIQVVLLRRKDASLTSVALTEKQSLPDVLGRHAIKEAGDKVRIFNLKTQKDVVMAMKRNYAQAGGLGGKIAKELLETGEYEVWHPLPASPGFTLVASEDMSEVEKQRLKDEVASLDDKVIAQMQKVFVSKLGSFVTDDDGNYRTLNLAMKEAGYL